MKEGFFDIFVWDPSWIFVDSGSIFWDDGGILEGSFWSS